MVWFCWQSPNMLLPPTCASGTQFFENEPFPFSFGNGGPDFCDGVGHCIDVQGPAGASRPHP